MYKCIIKYYIGVLFYKIKVLFYFLCFYKECELQLVDNVKTLVAFSVLIYKYLANKVRLTEVNKGSQSVVLGPAASALPEKSVSPPDLAHQKLWGQAEQSMLIGYPGDLVASDTGEYLD